MVQHVATAVEGGELEALPSHDFRTTTAKLLLEVAEAESACDVLEQLLLEVSSPHLAPTLGPVENHPFSSSRVHS